MLTLEELFVGTGAINGEIAVEAVKDIVKSGVTCVVTAKPGCGKLSTVAAMVQSVADDVTIRCLERSFESQIERSNRNVISFEIDSIEDTEEKSINSNRRYFCVSNEDLQCNVAATVLELVHRSRDFALFAFHTQTVESLVHSLRNTLSAIKDISLIEAEEVICEALRVNIHLDVTPEGERYLSRITEIFPNSCGENIFNTRDLLVYDVDTHTYVKQDCYDEAYANFRQHIS